MNPNLKIQIRLSGPSAMWKDIQFSGFWALFTAPDSMANINEIGKDWIFCEDPTTSGVKLICWTNYEIDINNTCITTNDELKTFHRVVSAYGGNITIKTKMVDVNGQPFVEPNIEDSSIFELNQVSANQTFLFKINSDTKATDEYTVIQFLAETGHPDQAKESIPIATTQLYNCVWATRFWGNPKLSTTFYARYRGLIKPCDAQVLSDMRTYLASFTDRR